MNFFKIKISLIALLIALFLTVKPQQPNTCVTYFNNPSFEGWRFFWPGIPPPEWTQVGPNQTPDMQPGFFGLNMQPTDGNWFLGLCHQSQYGWQEGVTQKINFPFEPGIKYSFKIDAANSSTHEGGTIPDHAQLLIYGGDSLYDLDTLLWSSNDLYPFDTWMTLNVSFIPNQQITWVTFLCYNLGNWNWPPTNPYIMLDNIRDVRPAQFNVNLTPGVISEPTCNGLDDGFITCQSSGKFSPFTYKWNTGETEQTIKVVAGTYNVTVTDSTGCSVTTSVDIGEPSKLEANRLISYSSCKTCDAGQINVFASGATPPYSYFWSTGSTSDSIFGLKEGDYEFTVTDFNGCSVSGSEHIVNTHNRDVFIPNAFSPNGDGNNDYFEAYGNKLNWKKMSVQVFNRDGILLFQSNDPDFKWDGRFDGEGTLPGVYVYIFKVTYLDTYMDEMRKGSVTVIK